MAGIRWAGGATALVVAVAIGCGTRPRPAAAPVEIDFFAASGIRPQELAAWLDRRQAGGAGPAVPLQLTLQNARGDVLVDSRVQVLWNTGAHRLRVSRSGIIGFPLDKSKLPGLKLLVPAGYTELQQRTVPLGTAYQPDQEPAPSDAHYHIVYDTQILATLKDRLRQLQAAGDVISYATLQDQLRRRRHPLSGAAALAAGPPPAAAPESRDLTPAEIYRQCKDSVVIVASLDESGFLLHAGGVVLDAAGVVATNYHTIDKPPSVGARGVMTWDGQFYPVREVLAADRAADVVLLQVAATGLHAAPLSPGDPEGSPVTVISHPGGRFFTLTHGYVSRYWAGTVHGRTAVMMAITADFADGSSGAPVFNARGAVAGLVSSTTALGNQMVIKEGPPAAELRRLFAPPAAAE